MKIAFFGSPDFAAKILDKIHKQFPISYVVSQNAKPAGRNLSITPTPVSTYAKQNNIPLFTPDNLDNFELPIVDVGIVIAYGLIIPKEIFSQSKFGFINIHYSLLPSYKGPSPVQWALLHGDTKTGITIQQIDEEIDHGKILMQKEITITEYDTTNTLLEKLNLEASNMLISLLGSISEKNVLPPLQEQDHTKQTFTKRLRKDDGFISLETVKKAVRGDSITYAELPNLLQTIITNKSSQQFNSILIHNFIRALNPWPLAWTYTSNGKRVKILKSTQLENKVEINQIQLEGKSTTVDKHYIAQLFQ